ncbi:MAG: NAD-dependent epimerase/dehydratase family protein, partial [Clostridia bacterium]|nr:NAD-dependent epimerase/dehydratase family protein [Clostridia bacterium]
MRILITGGYGFIGSHTAERFHKEGHDIYIIDNLSFGKKENLNIKHTFFNIDASDERCKEIFANNSIDVVIHLAAQNNFDQYDEYSKSNILGLVNMLSLSKEHNIKKFIFSSSASVYGNPTKTRVDEQEKCNPISEDGLNKLVGEKYCKFYNDIYGLNTVILRLSNVYGPRQFSNDKNSIAFTFFQTIVNNEITICQNREPIQDFIYVE